MLSWLVLIAAMLNAATTVQVSRYLELDGLYYGIAPGSTVEYVSGGLAAQQTSMIGCNRRNNQVQQFSNFALFYGPNLDIVYLSGWSYHCFGDATDEACALTMRSTTGDIVCGGAVTAPDPIFADGFDGR